jgi:hypothetical protein
MIAFVYALWKNRLVRDLFWPLAIFPQGGRLSLAVLCPMGICGGYKIVGAKGSSPLGEAGRGWFWLSFGRGLRAFLLSVHETGRGDLAPTLLYYFDRGNYASFTFEVFSHIREAYPDVCQSVGTYGEINPLYC